MYDNKFGYIHFIYLVIIYVHSMSWIFLKYILFLKIDFMVTTWNFHMVVCYKANLHCPQKHIFRHMNVLVNCILKEKQEK